MSAPTATAANVSPAFTPSFGFPAEWSIADLQNHLGVPPKRIRLVPPPGTATERDVLRSEQGDRPLCELVDGVLVEKTMGYLESRLAVAIGWFLETFVADHDLGIVLGEAGTLRILPRQVRIPDVCFLSWRHFPGRKLPKRPIPDLAPDLAVEVLSKSNTPREMDRKLRDYFAAGVRLVWYVDPRTKTAKAYTSLKKCVEIASDGTLEGGKVLPGFRLPLQQLFARAEGRRA
jgi:Uma2 family endonuclease